MLSKEPYTETGIYTKEPYVFSKEAYVHSNSLIRRLSPRSASPATHCNSLQLTQLTATHCNSLQRTPTHTHRLSCQSAGLGRQRISRENKFASNRASLRGPWVECRSFFESCLIRNSHVTYEWVMTHYSWLMMTQDSWLVSHTKQSCHVWMSHDSLFMTHDDSRLMTCVSYEWAMSHMFKSCHIWNSHFAYEWVMTHYSVSYKWVSYKWVMSHMKQSCHVCQNAWLICELWVMSFTRIRHVSRMNDSGLTHEWLTSHSQIATPWPFFNFWFPIQIELVRDVFIPTRVSGMYLYMDGHAMTFFQILNFYTNRKSSWCIYTNACTWVCVCIYVLDL